MTGALFGFVGVLIGAAVSVWGTFQVETWRERRRARAGARLVISDIQDARIYVKSALERDKWPRPPGSFSSSAWRESKDVFASMLDSKTWDSLSMLVRWLDMLDGAIAAGRRELPEGVHYPDPPMEYDEFREQLRFTDRMLSACIKLLAPFADHRPWWSRFVSND